MTTRRTFFKITAATAGSVLLGSGKVNPAEAPGESTNTLAVLTDISYCIGCRTCEDACNKVNSLPKPQKPFTDISVLDRLRRMNAKKYTVVNKYPSRKLRGGAVYVKIQCMHCLDPACVSACLVGAMIKTEEGPVIWNEAKCIGCRYCMIACPFGVPAYEYYKGIGPRVMKCTMCYPRIREGNMPGCAAACPMSVMVFGPRQQLIKVARERIEKNPDRYVDYIYGEHEVAGTGWMFIAPQEFASLDFIKLGNNAPPRLTEGIQHGLFKYFIPPVALFAFLGLTMVATKGKEEEQPHQASAAPVKIADTEDSTEEKS